MGNKLCKKKSDVVDNAKTTPTTTTFDRIINRLHLRPKAWKSDSQLNRQKQVRSNSNFYVPNDKVFSKSSNWTDVDLEVSNEKDEVIHLRNPKLSLIFDSEKLSTPTPPPRTHKKGGIREKIQAVAKTSLQAFQNKKPVDEPLCIKKIVQPTNPDDHNCALHRQEHKKNDSNHQHKNVISNKEAKRRKNLSVVSLPNYNELKLAVAHFDEDIDKKPQEQINDSLVSLPSSSEPKKITHTASTGKLESCMTRCRSFGSILPQQFLDKLRVKKISADIGSDDSFGGLEDWDLRLIEHYNPKDASLPRPRKHDKLPIDIESLIVQDDDTRKPQVPVRKSESLLKKINREASKTARTSFTDQEPDFRKGTTPPPSPNCQKCPTEQQTIKTEEFPVEENGRVEHSSLMKILEEFSMKDKQQQNNNNSCDAEQFKKNVASLQEFLYNEKKLN